MTFNQQIGINIRSACPTDTPAIAAMAQAMRIELGQQKSMLSAASLEKDCFSDSPRLSIVICEIQGEIRGYAIGQDFYDPHATKLGMHVCDIYVDKSCRGLKIGKLLLEALSDIARKREKAFLLWFASPLNERGMRLYEKTSAKSSNVVAFMMPL